MSQFLVWVRPMSAGLDLLTPLLTRTTVDEYLGTVVIGGAPMRQALREEIGGESWNPEGSSFWSG